jgi:hypothetical protein
MLLCRGDSFCQRSSVRRTLSAIFCTAGVWCDIVRILLAQGRFAPDRLKALGEGGEAAICRATSEISAPLLLLIILRLRTGA